jgi:hypothetical protein
LSIELEIRSDESSGGTSLFTDLFDGDTTIISTLHASEAGLVTAFTNENLLGGIERKEEIVAGLKLGCVLFVLLVEEINWDSVSTIITYNNSEVSGGNGKSFSGGGSEERVSIEGTNKGSSDE